MWLACALIVLFSVGFVLPCMLDITTTPDSEFVVLSKGMWLLITGAFWIFGAAAWLFVGRPQRPTLHRHGRYGDGFGQAGNWLPAPAAHRPLGPDDDPDFLEELHRRIHGPRDEA
jgi:hypothetical protein